MIQRVSHFDLLVIEDNPADMFLLVKMLKASSLPIEAIHSVDSLSQAFHLLAQYPNIRAVLLDLSLPDSFGLDTYIALRNIAPHLPAIILTGYADTSMALEALKEGAQDYLVKGQFEKELLFRSIQYSIERKQQAERVKESETKYRYMFHRNPFPSFITDMETFRILEVNDSACEKYQYTREEFLQMTIKDFRPPEDVGKLVNEVRQSDPVINRVLSRHIKKDGTLMNCEVTFYPISYFGKSAVQSQVNDITDKVKLEKELAQQRKQEQIQITQAVLIAQEKERTMLGEELHDNINQIIVSAKLYLDLAIKHTNGSIADMLKKSYGQLNTATEEIRKLSRTLIKPTLGTNNLILSITDLVDTVKLLSSVKIKLISDKLDVSMLTEDQQLAIYRIIQEQLNNIVKHAEANKVCIKLDNSQEDQLILIIEDNGKGFDPSERRKGVGLTNITSRAEVLNGKVEIESSPGNGCKLKVTFNNKSIAEVN
jgi:two-component system sensor histidine kinase UhpB